MLINTILDTEDFVHLYYPEDDVPNTSQGCSAGARMASKYQNRPATPEYKEVNPPSYVMCSQPARGGGGAANNSSVEPQQPAAASHQQRRTRAADAYPRPRMHADEPDLSVPFTPICGEFVQFLGRTSDGPMLSLSNYRLHAGRVSVPVRLIDSCEMKELLYLHIQCKDGRSLRCTFNSGVTCAEWFRRINAATLPVMSLSETFAAAFKAWAQEAPPLSPIRRLLAYESPPPYQRFRREVERLGFLTHGAWRVTEANVSYKLCPSYPPYLIVPASFGDEDLDSVARFRAARRIPAVVWRHGGNGAVLARSSQPEVGWFGWRNNEDERLLAALAGTCALDRAAHNKARLLVIDARSYTSAVTNRARGGGCEYPQYYPGADIQFMCLPNIHNVRKSFHQLRQLAAEPADIANWHSSLERTLWLQYISGLGRTAGVVARALLAARPVLVHCSDGWDRTPQVTAAAQLLLDPYYRTFEGFRVLIEREWLDFGHKFADRCGHSFSPDEPNERSPIFIQWLDLVHQIMKQYPCSFEFNEAYLIKLVTHAHSCMFGTFMCNNPCERRDVLVGEKCCSVWPLLESPLYRNHLYSTPSHNEVLWPEYSVRSLQFWWALYVGDSGHGCEVDEVSPATNGHPQTNHINTNGMLSKTRSCDNLAIDAEKPSKRRCSDPNLCPELVVSLAIGRDDSSERTDFSTSGSDLTAASGRNYDQVDGINMNHFENGVNGITRDITSNSSSLERELAGAATTVKRTHSDNVLSSNGADDTGVTNNDAAPANGTSNTTESSNNNTGSSEENVVFIEDSCFAELNINRDDIGRARQISITWRSVSESSHHTDSSAGFDLGDIANHNSILNSEKDCEDKCDDITIGMEERTEMTPTLSGILNTDSEPSTRGQSEESTAVLNDSSTENGYSDRGECECANSLRGQSEESTKKSKSEGSATPEMEVSNVCGGLENALTNGINHTRMDAASVKLLEVELGKLEMNGMGSTNRSFNDRLWWSEHTLCGANRGNGVSEKCASGVYGACDVDGLPVAYSPIQKRLHQMCSQQKALVEDLQSALAAALRARIPSPEERHGSHTPQDPSDIEIEMGVEAGTLWNSESARCQGCRNQFWFVRRKHHCRTCGGAFCSSCSWSGGEGRVCRSCTARR